MLFFSKVKKQVAIATSKYCMKAETFCFIKKSVNSGNPNICGKTIWIIN
jgi:hypothetical protein